MIYYVNNNGKLEEVIIHIWRNPVLWWRKTKEFLGSSNFSTTYAETIQEYERIRPHDGLIDGSGVQSVTDANLHPERETE